MKEPLWLTLDELLAFHERLIAEFGGTAGVRDEGSLESALGKPKNLFTCSKPTMFELAASYAFGIVKNHPFIDGNKRTGFMAAYTFLGKHQWELGATEADAAVQTLRLAANDCLQADYAAWLKRNCRKAR